MAAQRTPRTLVVRRLHEEARSIRAFDVLPEGAAARHDIAFAPGQVAVLQLDGGRPSYFAFASAPEDAELEFLVKRTADPSTQMFYDLAEGSRVELLQVVGHGFDLASLRGRDLVFVAMGTGVAPLRSALRTALRRLQDFGRVVVLYGARTPDDFCYTDEIDTWKDAGVELRQVISRPDGYEWAGPTGYVQSLLDHVLPELPAPVALVCGSRDMIAQTRDRLRQMGLAPDTILTNY